MPANCELNLVEIKKNKRVLNSHTLMARNENLKQNLIAYENYKYETIQSDNDAASTTDYENCDEVVEEETTATNLCETIFKCICFSIFLIIFITYKIKNNNDQLNLAIENFEIFAAINDTLEYYVHTNQCFIPAIDPFSKEIRKIFKPKKYKKCSKDAAIIEQIYDDNKQVYILHFNEQVARQFASKNSTNPETDVSCCYHDIVRPSAGKKPDNSYKLLPCAQFHQDFEVPKHIDAMIIKCHSKVKNKLVQEDALSFVQYKPVNDSVDQTNNRRKPSVLLLGIDTMSKINFRRNMPKTFSFLKDRNWYELLGYNKVGDNTYPNLMPLLTGHNYSTILKKCNPVKAGGIEKCEFLWNSFKKQGYRTAYAEDLTRLSTFNYRKYGFQKPPTDYYLRPMAMAMVEHMKLTSTMGLHDCIGRKHFAEYVYDYAVQFSSRYKNEPIFGLFWTNSFSHNAFDTASAMDNKMLEYLKTFENNNVLKDAIMIFFSDHGIRWGKMLEMPEGFLENRLPIFFMHLPNWFKNDYPEIVRAMEINQKRLTSPYDIHKTIKQIMHLHETEIENTQSPELASDCSTSESIFAEISENRTCNDACIPEHWCTCTPYKIVSTKTQTAKNLAKLILEHINEFLNARNLSEFCSELNLKSIASVQQQIIALQPEQQHDVATYRVYLLATPSKPKFEATVAYDKTKETIELDMQQISRLDSYEPDSRCIEDKDALPFCICKK